MSNNRKCCRFCGSILQHTFVDLGMSPLANSYLKSAQLRQMEPFYPLHVYVCEQCFLVQLEELESPERIFSDYAYRREITIPSSQVDENLTNFPMLFSISDTYVTDANIKTSGSNYTIKFTNSTGTELPYEVEYYDSGSNTLVAWVKVDSLSSSSDNTLYFYYGAASTDSTEQASSVWTNDYVSVWHLADNAASTTVDDIAGKMRHVYDRAINGHDMWNRAGIEVGRQHTWLSAAQNVVEAIVDLCSKNDELTADKSSPSD